VRDRQGWALAAGLAGPTAGCFGSVAGGTSDAVDMDAASRHDAEYDAGHDSTHGSAHDAGQDSTHEAAHDAGDDSDRTVPPATVRHS
jgi:hypothetical protein